MFNGRLYRTRLPTVKMHPSAFHEEVKQNDLRSKEVMKKQSDSKSYVKQSEIAKGDLVLIKQQKLNKHTPPYHPQPFEVLERKGSMIVARKGQQVVERHVNHCKRFTRESTSVQSKGVRWADWESASEEEERGGGPVPEENEVGEEEQSEPLNNEYTGEAAAAGSRSLRAREGLRKPARYRDEANPQ